MTPTPSGVPAGQFVTFLLPQTADYEDMVHEVQTALGDVLGTEHWAHEPCPGHGGILSVASTQPALYEAVESRLASIAERYGIPAVFWLHAPLRTVRATDA